MLQIVYKPTAKLIPYVNNSRTHTESQIKQVAASIREFGFTNPVLVDEQEGIIAGHGRVLAATLLDIQEVPTITLAGLTEAQKRAYVIADNKLALNSGWDMDLLKIEIESLQDEFNVELLGFDNAELEALFFTPDFEPATEEEQGQLDELDPKWCTCPNCGKEFDLRETQN